MQLTMAPGVQSWIKSLPPGGTISVRMKTAAELLEERGQIEKLQDRNREAGR
jgi:hypothetical protein